MYNARRYGISIEKYELLYKVYENCMKLDEFINASPEKQPDAQLK